MGDAPPPPAAEPVPAPAPPPPPPAAALNERPTGVTVLAVLYFIQSIMMMATGFIIDSMFSGMFDLFASLPGSTGDGLGMLCILPFIILGLVYFLIGFGLLKMKGWARTVAIVFAIIGLIGIPIGTIISIIILIYLFKPEIKAAFQK